MQTKLLIGAAALVGAMVLPATIALAAPPPPSFSFSLNLGGDNNGPPPQHHFDGGPPPPRFNDCMSPREILGDLADQGYSRFIMVDHTRHTLTVDARRRFRWYELTVDSCDGEIIDSTRIMQP